MPSFFSLLPSVKPPPPYCNSKGGECLSHVGREGLLAETPKSDQLLCYLNRTDHVLATPPTHHLVSPDTSGYCGYARSTIGPNYCSTQTVIEIQAQAV